MSYLAAPVPDSLRMSCIHVDTLALLSVNYRKRLMSNFIDIENSCVYTAKKNTFYACKIKHLASSMHQKGLLTHMIHQRFQALIESVGF